MKLNNRGYAITVIVFGILIVFIIVLSSLLVTMNNSVKLNKVVKEDVIENIQLGADTTGMSLTERIEQIENKLSNISSNSNVIDTIYPVGSIYISATDDSIDDVVARFGGQWEVYAQGRTLVGVGSTTDTNGNSLVYNAGELSEDGVTYKGQTGGSILASLSTTNLPSHSHSIPKLSGTAANSGSGYKLAYNTTGTNNASTGNQSANHTHNFSGTTGPEINYNVQYGISYLQDLNTNNQGIGRNSAVPPYAVATADGGLHYHAYSGTTGSNSANHTHNYTNRYVTGVSGVESHSHSVTTSANNTGNTGSGAAFSVQDPYITVYMYKRIK